MSVPVIIDTNLLLLLVVGLADRRLIISHKRVKDDFTQAHFDQLVELVSSFSDILLIPNLLTEVSNLARQIGNPARSAIQRQIRKLVESSPELYVPSPVVVCREEFIVAGLTDAALLHLCSMMIADRRPVLLTVDQPLFSRATALGYHTLNFRDF